MLQTRMQYPHVIAGFVVFRFRNDSEVLAYFTERFSHQNSRLAINQEEAIIQSEEEIQLHSLQ